MLWLVLALVVACGSIDPRRHQGVDPEFEEYVEIFEQWTGKSVYDTVPVNFDSVGEHHAGEAWTYTNLLGTYCEVAIDASWWVSHPNRTLREILISHELGHCTGLDHSDRLVYGQPDSIMFWSVAYYDTGYFELHRAAYYAELGWRYAQLKEPEHHPYHEDN